MFRESISYLSLHGPNSCIEKEQPIVYFEGFARSWWERNFVFWVVAGDEVLLDGAGFEEVDLFAIGKRIRESGDSAIGVYGKKPGFLLGVL